MDDEQDENKNLQLKEGVCGYDLITWFVESNFFTQIKTS